MSCIYQYMKKKYVDFTPHMEKFEKEYLNDRTTFGTPMRKRVLKQAKYELKSKKEHLQWTKKTIRRIERLIKSKDKIIYIYDHVEFTPMPEQHWDGKADYSDVQIALPIGLFGRLRSLWITTLLSKNAYKSDMKEVLEDGGLYVSDSNQTYDPMNVFDNYYLDVDCFSSEQNVIDGFKEWARYFMPEVLDWEIRFELKDFDTIKDKIHNLFYPRKLF